MSAQQSANTIISVSQSIYTHAACTHVRGHVRARTHTHTHFPFSAMWLITSEHNILSKHCSGYQGVFLARLGQYIHKSKSLSLTYTVSLVLLQLEALAAGAGACFVWQRCAEIRTASEVVFANVAFCTGKHIRKKDDGELHRPITVRTY